MNPPPRLLMDVSYTRTQRVNVGITRTVRRLEGELRKLWLERGGRFTSVSYHSQGFRELSAGMPAQAAQAQQAGMPDKQASSLFQWITGGFFRRMVLIAVNLPGWMLSALWATTSSWAFNFLSRAERPVNAGPRDILLLCDASWNFPAWRAVRKARDGGAKVVLMIHDLMPLRHPEFCFALVPPTFRLWLDQMLPLADAVMCNSGATEADLRRFAAEAGIRLCPTAHFHLGSDLVQRGSPEDAGVRDSLRQFLQEPPPCFVAIGSIEPKKNHRFLLEVFDRLWAAGVSARLLVVGRNTGEWPELIESICGHPQAGKLLLIVFDATDAEVAYAYSNCRALVFPSLAEGFGLPLVEARTRGALVIASNLPVFTELADEGVSLYPQGDAQALADLVAEHARTDRRATVAPMQPFTWQDSARQFIDRAQALLAAREGH